ncbi:unnamed protein product [Sphenostylis stenocarpa]|uniref:3-hydroxyisobutyrate dehydrogenase-like NAD-binding domain-containing protein n=1 Tax=Sphenostylis stenocarpa TaxID=92480 RepID=A0AA86W2X4_9FABA|nr:unnamed protein product [Sphenostylis stenocarpa]
MIIMKRFSAPILSYVWSRAEANINPLLRKKQHLAMSPLPADPQSVLDVACGKHGAAPVSGSKKPAEDGQLVFYNLFPAFAVTYPSALMIKVVSQGAISAPMYSTKGPSMIQSLYPTAFPLKHQQKDLRLALGLAESVSQSTPIAAAANELYKVAKSHGLSDQDFSAVIEALKSKFQHSETK